MLPTLTTTLALAAPLAIPADAPVVDPLKYLVACMGVLGLLALGLLALRKLVVGAQRARASGRDLAVLDQLHLGGSKRLAVVRCYDRQFVLGVGDKEISLVAELDADQAVPPLAERGRTAQPHAEREQPTAREAFSGLLQRAQKLADAVVPPRKPRSTEAELPVSTVRPAAARPEAAKPSDASGVSLSGQRRATPEHEPSREVKAKVARELLAKLGPDHELLGAVRAAAQKAPERAGAGRPERRERAREHARSERRPAAGERPARAAASPQPAAEEGWLG